MNFFQGRGRGRTRPSELNEPGPGTRPEPTDPDEPIPISPQSPYSIGAGRGRGRATVPIGLLYPTGDFVGRVAGSASSGIFEAIARPHAVKFEDDIPTEYAGPMARAVEEEDMARSPTQQLSRSVSTTDISDFSDIESDGGLSDTPSTISTAATTTTTTTVTKADSKPESGTVKKSDLWTDLTHGKLKVDKKGKKGDLTPLETNFLKLTICENKELYQYVVKIEPELEDVRKIRQIIYANEGTLGKAVVYDEQGMLFLPHKLAKETTFSYVDPSSNNMPIKVKVTRVKHLRMDESVQFYNVLFNRVNIFLGLKMMKRHYFNYKATHMLPMHKLEIWPGYVTSIDVFEDGLLLCIDTASRVLRTSTVLELHNEMSRLMSDEATFREKFMENVVGTIVITRYTKNSTHYKINDVAWNQNPMSTFVKDGKTITFADYYKNQYNIVIKDLRQPMLLSVSTRKRDCMPGAEPVVFSIVPELCHQTGMSDAQRGNYSVMKDVAQFTRLGPNERQKCIKTYLENIRDCPKAMELLDMWGIEMNDSLVKINGRIVGPPKIEYGNGRVSIASADFSRDSTSGRCFEPVEINRWKIFCVKFDKSVVDGMITVYQQVARSFGIGMAKPVVHEIVPRSRNVTVTEYIKAIRENVPKDTQIIVLIFPMQRDDLYSAVKKHCLCENAMPSQVILTKTLKNEKRLRSVVQKIALQINCKLGGAIWSLTNPLKEKYMFIGFDVHHDPKRKLKSAFSIVAVLNNFCTRYFSLVNFHEPHKESTEKMQQLFVAALQAYYKENESYPDYIIVFRDGVGDGQLLHVKNTEVVQLENACKEVCGIVRPKITYIVVQKRIVERFLFRDRVGYDNAKSGTVIDHTVTKDWLYDFFVVSQITRQGTITPTHYIVIHDTAEKGPDMLQKFSYVLSFMYFNWPGTIRVPAPCQYAHKLAFLAGEHLLREPKPQVSNTLYYL